MRFHDRVEQLKKLVKEKNEVPVSELTSLLGVSPNYARELRKEALKSGELVEDEVTFLGRGGRVDISSRQRYLFDFEYYTKVLRKQKKDAPDGAHNPARAGCCYCVEEKIKQGMEESKAREASQRPMSELKVSDEGYLCIDHFRSRPRVIGG